MKLRQIQGITVLMNTDKTHVETILEQRLDKLAHTVGVIEDSLAAGLPTAQFATHLVVLAAQAAEMLTILGTLSGQQKEKPTDESTKV